MEKLFLVPLTRHPQQGGKPLDQGERRGQVMGEYLQRGILLGVELEDVVVVLPALGEILGEAGYKSTAFLLEQLA
ncbi:hypothetical protein [Rufibacter sediminis]|uniref:hypothetical protein n=1 Tax=Rufibacter sediminis TaxID=2762756 RepID=UPI00210DBD47|nr:hypothetical protein [Rufibacter sediminis]